MSRKWVALSVDNTTKNKQKKKKRRRYNGDIHDENVENQQPSPHPKPSIILPQAFLHDPNTFKSVSHISATNNTSSTVLNVKNVDYSMSQNPSFIPKSFFYHYISLHCPITQAISLEVFYHYVSLHYPKTKTKPGFPAS